MEETEDDMAPVIEFAKSLARRLGFETGNYPYVCARVKAKKALLYPPDMYQKFLQMSVPQIGRTLGEGEYREEFLALGVRYSGVDLIEMATRDNLARVYTQILDISEGELKSTVSSFIDRWDVWNIQTILRGKLYGARPEEIMEEVIPAGSCTLEFLKDVVEKETIEDVIECFAKAPYYETLVEAKKAYDETRSLAPLEDALNKKYYSILLGTLDPGSEPDEHFLRFIRMEIDLHNLRTLLRLNLNKAEPYGDVFMDGGMELEVDELGAMVKMDWDSLCSRLKKCSFYEGIAADLGKAAERGLNEVLRSLERQVLRAATRHANIHPLSILPVLDFMLAKKNEVDNIRIVARGKENGLDSEVIRGLLLFR